MDFLKKLFGISDRFNGQVIQENSNETIPQKTPVPSFLSERFPWIENAFRVEENDCASCKYIGSGLSYGICIFMLAQLRAPPKEAINRKIPFYMTVASMSTTFFILGTCRLFDIGFSAQQDEGQKKTFIDFVNDDLEALKKYLNNFTRKDVIRYSNESNVVLDKLQKERNEKDK